MIKIFVNLLIYETACYYNNIQFRDDFLLKFKMNSDSIIEMIQEVNNMKRLFE